ncbi:MAG TPA: hypothetical protein VN577_18380 [Terriglobales bacterium]|nr:hypothetical protein [Terriglobales bacterium]
MEVTEKCKGTTFPDAAVAAEDQYAGQRGLVRTLPWCSKLRDVIRPGSVLVYSRMIRLPHELSLEGWPFGKWSILGGIEGGTFERELRTRGWQFRRWPRLGAWATGFSYYAALALAIEKLTSCGERQYRNALEISTVRDWRILTVHFVRITAVPATVYWSREHVFNRPAA